jgi:hypothetical protein
MFFPGKGAFRAGSVDDSQWDDVNTGLSSVAFGRNTVASGYGSTAFGVNCTASGSNTIAMGLSVTATGSHSTAIGIGSDATGDASTALGYGAIASGHSSMALGLGTTAKARGSVALGLYNDVSDAPSPTSTNVNDRIFQVGNGPFENVRTNAITVLRSGNTGIGVLDPTYRIDIGARMRIRSGGNAGTSAGIWLNKNDNSGLLGFVGVDGNNDIGIFSSASNWSFLVNTTNGNAWVKGTVTANGVTLTSDERLKKDIVPLGEAMPLLEKLNGYQYHWKNETWDASLQTGLLAQEVEKVLPELVKTDDKGMKSVNYIGLLPYMLEAIKMQQTTITTQQMQIEELKKMVENFVKK